MAKKIIRPLKGIDVDSSTNRRDDNSIYMAKNLRLNNFKDSSTGEYSNIRGMNIAIDGGETLSFLKIAKIANNILMFIKGAASDYIVLIKEEYIPKKNEETLTIDITNYYWNGTANQYHKVFSADLGFEVGQEIHVKTYYEDDDIQKVYWTTDGQPLRALNFIYSENNDPSSFSNKDLEMIPSGDLNRAELLGTISGSLSTGRIFYTYKAINSLGAETNLAPFSYSYHLTKSSDDSSNDYNYKGYGIDVDSEKGVALQISNVPDSFNRIKVYSINYIDDVSSPKINLIYDGFILNELKLNDTGTSLLELTTEEFYLENSSIIKNGNLEIKNNRLFMSNYQEEYFDIDTFASGDFWDSRSFRFEGNDSYPNARLFENDLISYVEIGYSGINIDEVPEEHDCINISNDISSWNSETAEANYIYKSDGTTIGSEGPNISITQSKFGYLTPDVGEEEIKWYSTKNNSNDQYDSSASVHYAGEKRTFKLEEVYRLYIQFKNNKGQLSYPKWICDYKYIYDHGTTEPFVRHYDEIQVSGYSLDFEVSNIPIDEETGEAFEYRILYVPVEEQNQSVYWGAFQQIPNLDGTNSYKATGVNNINEIAESYICQDSKEETTIDLKYAEFISPDYCLGNKKSYKYVKFIKKCLYSNLIGTHQAAYQSNIYKAYVYSDTASPGLLYELDLLTNVEYSVDISGSVTLDGTDKLLRRGSTVVSLKNESEYNYGTCSSKKAIFGNSNKGRCQIIKPSSNLPSEFENSTILGCAYVDNFESRYGGLSYSARKNNGSIPLSGFTNSEELKVYGDCQPGNFEYLRLISDNSLPYIADNQEFGSSVKDLQTEPKYTPGSNEVLIFPTYSEYNLRLRSDDFLTKVYTQSGAYMLHEFTGVYEDTIQNDETDGDPIFMVNKDEDIYTQKIDLYTYNKTYTRPQDLFVYYEKPILSSIVSDFKNRIISSNQKILGESSDSFLRQSSSYIDIDGQYGEIVKLYVFNDKLFFFQNSAIGIVAVNEQSTTNNSDGSSIILGEVGLLSRFDYLTTENGISDPNHICKSSSALYVIDSIRKQILKIGTSIEKISITKNINTILQSVELDESRIIYNRKYNEVLFFYSETSSSTNQKALVFNEQIQQFVGIYDFRGSVLNSIPINRSDLNNELVLNDNSLILGMDEGNYNQLSDAYEPSEITFLISSDSENVVLFNVIEAIIRQIDSDDNFVNFIDTIRIYNNEYDTGTLDFSTSTKEKFGKFRTSKLRNYIGNNERILSDHIYVTITTTDNSGNEYRVFFRDLIVSFSEYMYFGY